MKISNIDTFWSGAIYELLNFQSSPPYSIWQLDYELDFFYEGIVNVSEIRVNYCLIEIESE